jgi:hypothetical protein
MLQAIGLIICMPLAYTMFALVAEHLPTAYAIGISLLFPLIGFAGAVRFFLQSNLARGD